MRILHVFDHSLPLQSGYTFRSRAILREQRNRGWETVQLTTPRHVQAGPNPETVEEGLVFHRTPAPGRSLPAGLAELAEMRATRAALLALARKTQPDILHAHSPVLNALPTLSVARALNIPCVYEIRATWEDAAVSHGTAREGGPKYRATRWLETYAARRVDALACICDGLRGDMVARGVDPERIVVIPNAVDIDQFSGVIPRDQELSGRLGLDDCEVVGFLGSYYDYEGLELLVEAAERLRDSRPRLKVLLVGGGPEEDRLKQRIAASGLQDTVIAVGRVPHAEVDRYYSLVDILAYPRKRSRLTDLVTPLKPLEAMAQGKLVVASDVGGHKELIRDGVTGALFPADDPVALAATLARLFDSRESWPAIHAAGLAYVREERTWARSVANYEPVYARLAKRRAKAA